MTWYYYLVSICFGLVFGSFFNVAIYRLPREKSLGRRSKCPSCESVIRWYDNVPVLSFVMLRGRCRKCGARISWQYPLVEITTALLFALIYWWSTAVLPGLLDVAGGKAFQPEVFIGLVLVSVLIVITGADITHGMIPNKAIIAGLALMIPMVVAFAIYRGQPGRIGISFATAAGGAAFFLMAGLIYGFLFMRGAPGATAVPAETELSMQGLKSENQLSADSTAGELENEQDKVDIQTGVGMGDVKLMLVTGLALGYFHWYFVVVQVFLAALIGAISFIPLKWVAGKGRKDRIAFGPFLTAGSIIALVWGQLIVDVYIKLLR